MRASILVVGIGNELLGDEGVGVHVARALEAQAPGAAPFDVLEAGTSLLDAALEMSRYERVVLIDAVLAGREPVTVYRWEEAAGLADGAPQKVPLSLHDGEAAQTLRAARAMGLEPPHLTLIGVEPANLAMGTELSPEARRAAQRIVAQLLEEFASKGSPSSATSTLP